MHDQPWPDSGCTHFGGDLHTGPMRDMHNNMPQSTCNVILANTPQLPCQMYPSPDDSSKRTHEAQGIVKCLPKGRLLKLHLSSPCHTDPCADDSPKWDPCGTPKGQVPPQGFIVTVHSSTPCRSKPPVRMTLQYGTLVGHWMAKCHPQG